MLYSTRLFDSVHSLGPYIVSLDATVSDEFRNWR